MMDRFVCMPIHSSPNQPMVGLMDIDSKDPYDLKPEFGWLFGHPDILGALAKGLNMRPGIVEVLRW